MWRFLNSVEIIGGTDALGELSRIVANQPYSIVTYSSDLFADYAQEVSVAVGYPPVSIINRVEENPSFDQLTVLCRELRDQPVQPELFIALGGGSVMDTTKVLAASGGDFNRVERYLKGELPCESLTCKPFVAIPTTAGTGSEVTCWGTLWDPCNGTKYSLADERLYPRTTIVHAPFTARLPRAVTISTGLDALSHALESLWNRNRNPVSSSFAITAARAILATLPAVLQQPHNLELRAQMMEAALLAGLAFSNTKTSIAHNISYAVTLEKGTPHGIACSFTLPAIMRAIDPADRQLFSAIEAIFGQPPEQAAVALTAFLNALDINTEPSEYGYSQAAWDALVQTASKGPRGKNFSGDVSRLLSQFKQGITA